MHRLWNEHYILADILRRVDCAPHLAWVARHWHAALQAARLLVKQTIRLNDYTCNLAADGHTRLLQWYVAHGYREHSWLIAATRGNRGDTMEWLLSLLPHPPATVVGHAIESAAFLGDRAALLHFEPLANAKQCNACAIVTSQGHAALGRELAERGWAIDCLTLSSAAGIGDLGFVQWLQAHGAEPGPTVAVAAAKHGHVEVLQWCITNGMPIVRKAAHKAAYHGHIDALGLLDAIFPMGEYEEAEAARGGHVRVTEWLHNRIQHDQWLALPAAICARQRDVIDWLLAHGHPRLSDDMRYAFDSGYDGDFVRWMLSRGFEPCNLEGPLAYLRLDAVKDIYSLGFALSPDMYMHLTRRAYRFGPAYARACQWLFDQGVAPSLDMLLRAIGHRSADGVEWAVRHGLERTINHVIRCVADGAPDDVEWMLDHGWPTDPASLAAYRAAYEENKMYYFAWSDDESIQSRANTASKIRRALERYE